MFWFIYLLPIRIFTISWSHFATVLLITIVRDIFELDIYVSRYQNNINDARRAEIDKLRR